MNWFWKKIKRTKILVAGGLLCVAVLTATTVDNYFEISKNLDIFTTLYKELNLFYVDETDPGKLMKTAIDEMLKSLDPYTVFIPESEVEDHRFMITGQYGGIGASIRPKGEDIIISDPYENYPAHKAGLWAGDVILEIDGKTLKGKSTDEVSRMLKGQPGTTVRIKLQRTGAAKPTEKSLTREDIKVENVPYSGMLSNEVGYICLTNFTNKASQDVKKAFSELKDGKGMKKLIFDLRDNPGGLLREAVNIVNFFVPKGSDVVSTRGRTNEWEKIHKALNVPVDLEIPIVVLVNRSSASASEIVAGALQDIDRCVVIGQRTFGKGLVQQTRQLNYNAQVKLTTAKYYIPSGRCIQILDYSHRNEDGSVGKVPDSLIKEYKTRNGRIVHDGGGITPDIQIEIIDDATITKELNNKMYIFDYATKYRIEHAEIALPKEFKITDNQYEDFIHYLEDKEFDYSNASEKHLKNLQSSLVKENREVDATKEIESLFSKLKPDKKKELLHNRFEIIRKLKSEIVSRYHFQRGQIETTLNDDNEIKRAIEVLNDSTFYTSLLHGLYQGEITGDKKNK